MKKQYFLAMLCIAFISYSKDDLSSETKTAKISKEEVTGLNFSTEGEMEQKINDILELESLKEKVLQENCKKSEDLKNGKIVEKATDSKEIEEQDRAIINSLKIILI